MRNRITKFMLGDEISETRVVNKGLPQDGVLSPTLYNLYNTRNLAKESMAELKCYNTLMI